MPNRFDNFCVSIAYATGQHEEFNVDAETLIREYPFLATHFNLKTPDDFHRRNFREISWEINYTRFKIFPFPKPPN